MTRRHRWTPEQDAAIRAWVGTGEAVEALALRLGRDRRVLVRRMLTLGVTPAAPRVRQRADGRYVFRGQRGQRIVSAGDYATEAEARRAAELWVAAHPPRPPCGERDAVNEARDEVCLANERGRIATAEHWLRAAVIENALTELMSLDGDARREAREWFEGERGAPGFGFVEVAEAIGLDPVAVRQKLGIYGGVECAA